MKYTLYDYQVEASNAAYNFFLEENDKSGLMVLPTGAGKSLVISDLSHRLFTNFGHRILIIQSTIDILGQNYAKYLSYGNKASIYSASFNSKEVGEVTFCSIGSIVNKAELFKDFKYVIIDEVHTAGNESMYSKFFKESKDLDSPKKIMGLTATPYRYSFDGYGGSQLKFLTRTRPRIVDTLVYHIQVKDLIDRGKLTPTTYYNIKTVDRSKLQLNSTGSDYKDESLRKHYDEINYKNSIADYANRLLKVRKNLLVFVKFISDAKYVAAKIPGAVVISSETNAKERKRLTQEYKDGKIRCVVNVGVFVIGFDKEDLETVLFARSVMSMAVYYQSLGRGSRIHPNKKDFWFVDMGDNINLFGHVEDFHVHYMPNGTHYVTGIVKGKVKQLTNVYFQRD